MSTGLKVVLWVLGGIAVFITLIIVAGMWFYRSMGGSIEEATKFAATATKEQCTAEFSNRLKACTGVSCIMSVSAWGGVCLGASRGSQEEFCAQVPAAGDSNALRNWSTRFCEEHALPPDKCAVATGIVNGYCSTRR